ncbi:MAG: hypothetical protein ACFFER_03085 [Candidatus Thorarchaeota archaeon]
MLIGAVELVLVYFAVLLLVVPVGYLTIRIVLPDLISKENLIAVFLLSQAFGVSFSIPFWWLLSFFSLSLYTLLMPSIVAILAILIDRFHVSKKRRNEESVLDAASRPTKLLSRSNAFLIILYSITLVYLGIATLRLGWAQVGDPWVHGTLIILLEENSHLPTSMLPINDVPVFYPLGYHLLIYSVNLLTNLMSGQTTIIVAAFFLALLPPLCAWCALQLSQRYTVSMLAYVLSLYSSTSGAEYSVWGYIYNGTYAVIIAAFIPISAFIMFSLHHKHNAKGIDDRTLLTLVLILGFSCAVAYPSNLIVIGLFFIVGFLQTVFRRIGDSGVRASAPYTVATLLVVSAIGIIAVYAVFNTDYFSYLRIFFTNEGQSGRVSQNYLLKDTYLTEPIVLFSISFAFLYSLLAIRIRKKGRSALLVYILYTVAFLLSKAIFLYEVGLYFILPERAIVVVAFMSAVLASMIFARWDSEDDSTLKTSDFLNDRLTERSILEQILERERKVIRSVKKRKFCSTTEIVAVVMLVSMIMIPSLVGHFGFGYVNSADWYVTHHTFEPDISGIFWLKDNIENDDLVLNSESYPDLFFHAAGISNVVYSISCNATRALALRQIWFYPENESSVIALLTLYNVKWIYVSGFWARVDVVAGNNTALPKLYHPNSYTAVFDTYSFLDKQFQMISTAGTICAVFRVVF